jgi:signal transduction histidine kinase
MAETRAELPRGVTGLSARLLVLTIAFVMLSEVLIYAPSIARFRQDWLQDRIGAAHLATLALEATPDNMVSESLKTELLDHAGAKTIIIAKPGEVRRVLAPDMPPMADAVYDLRNANFVTLIVDAILALGEPRVRMLRIVDVSPKDRSVVVEVLIDDRDLRAAMIDYSRRILALSLIISFLTATLVYLTLQWLMVRPLRRLTESMVAFRVAPEHPDSIIGPSARRDEIGVAQRELSHMEQAVRSALKQRALLAALGGAVAKINHDLRNILAAARLMSDRLVRSSDPLVQKAAPGLLSSIDRAVSLCEHTLGYAREELPPPHRTRFVLAELVREVGEVVSLLTEARAVWDARVPVELEVVADREQLFRVLVNLGRNAAEAGARTIDLSARPDGASVVIDVADDGPGLPKNVVERLFEPFAGTAKPGGSGLGLAIAHELARAHGGELALLTTSPRGTTFRLTLPAAAVRSAAAE